METQFVLDTNLFFNLQSGLPWGKTSKEVIQEFTKYSKKLTAVGKASFYMTPGILEEFKSFFTDEPDYLRDFLTSITIQSPNMSESVVGAVVMRELVDEARTRAYRGMKVAEEEIDQAARRMVGTKELNTMQYQKELGIGITKFRERFRHATRFNFLDSSSDFELIMLAKEVNGALVSADEGVVRWGRMIGVKEVSPPQLQASLEALM